jgi:prepilin-type N-terminal cleavage/methylation domain-containing protein
LEAGKSAGFSLVEVLISIVVFSAVILALAGLSLQIADRTVKATDQALVMATQLAGTDRATAVDYDSLSTMLTPDTITSGQVRVIVSYVVDSLSTTLTDVYVITSTSVPGMSPETLVISRSRVRYPIPLK